MSEKILKNGICVRKDGWTNCVVEIEDIGGHSFWGRLIDIKYNLLIDPVFIGQFDDADWHFVHDVDRFLNQLSTIKGQTQSAKSQEFRRNLSRESPLL